MSSLSEQQKIAVETTEGPLLIIAGPGSGKTFTLVERILYLIKNNSVQPKNIVVATFTEKAAKELITRISNRVYDEKIMFNLNEMYVGTIHSICLRILEENREYTRLKKNYTLLDQFDQQYLIFQKILIGKIYIERIRISSSNEYLNFKFCHYPKRRDC